MWHESHVQNAGLVVEVPDVTAVRMGDPDAGVVKLNVRRVHPGIEDRTCHHDRGDC